jgi:hypothetical protein
MGLSYVELYPKVRANTEMGLPEETRDTIIRNTMDCISQVKIDASWHPMRGWLYLDLSEHAVGKRKAIANAVHSNLQAVLGPKGYVFPCALYHECGMVRIRILSKWSLCVWSCKEPNILGSSW